MNRDIRHWLPKGTDFKKVSENKIDWIMENLNGRIRNCLNWNSSKQLFLQYLKNRFIKKLNKSFLVCQNMLKLHQIKKITKNIVQTLF